MTGYNLVALETCIGAEKIFETRLPESVILIAGSENKDLPALWIEKCHKLIFIQMPGACKSMNVFHALAMGAFDW